MTGCKFRSPALEELAREWQEILRLQDWSVRVLEVPAHDLKDSLGQCYTLVPKRSADIHILRDGDRQAQEEADDGTRFFPSESKEQSLVHELLHLYTAQLGIHELEHDDKRYIAMEQMVDGLAGALIRLRRGDADGKSQELQAGIQVSGAAGADRQPIQPQQGTPQDGDEARQGGAEGSGRLTPKQRPSR